MHLLLKGELPQTEDMAPCDAHDMRQWDWKLIPPPRTPPGMPSTGGQQLERVRALRDHLRTRTENPEEYARGILNSNFWDGRVVHEEERRAAFFFLAGLRMARARREMGSDRTAGKASSWFFTEEQLQERARILDDHLRTRSKYPEECAQEILDSKTFEGRVVRTEELKAASDFLAEVRMARSAADTGTSREEAVNRS